MQRKESNPAGTNIHFKKTAFWRRQKLRPHFWLILCDFCARGPRLHSKVSDFQSLNVFINFYDEIKDVFLRKNAFFRTSSELPLPLPNLYRDTYLKKCFTIELGMFENISLPSLIYLGSLEEALLNIENSSSKFSLKYPLIVHCDCQC